MNQARTGESKKAKSGAAPRAAAAYALQQVLQHQRSLNQALPEAVAKFKLDASDKGLAQAVAFGVLRELPSLEWYVSQLLDKPLKSKVRIVHYLMLVGLYQLSAMRTASHAAVSASVEATVLVRQKALKGLVNAVLRGFQRQQHNLETQLAQQADKRYNHPGWLLKHLQTGYPEHWQSIVEANQHQPPMWLRVNQRYLNQQRMQLSDYQAQLSALGIESEAAAGLPQALRLKQACDVTALPGFADGAVSVQDAAAQYAAQLVPAQSGQRVLDACAAPGGKTAHLLELYDIEVDALDIEQTRLARVSENLARLHLSARIIHADASTQDWWDGALYDHILLDAPCSATGVIRRHPDIKWLRQATDIANLVALQQQIFSNMWQLLKPGGTLIYATCSVLPHENALQVMAFLEQHTDAELIPCEGPDMAHIVAPELGAGTANTTTAMPPNTQIGLQWLPQIDSHDGFYYAVLRKAVN
ncbi:MAG: 16S rRNA (cytosine(967)-C(5))-methyltransferase RsmB [Firmicutes bacterium]|nr:16S rRNA (cytosine(967)-C(5))-methyltransferase RsmB [Bacillota bacterium]